MKGAGSRFTRSDTSNTGPTYERLLNGGLRPRWMLSEADKAESEREQSMGSTKEPACAKALMRSKDPRLPMSGTNATGSSHAKLLGGIGEAK